MQCLEKLTSKKMAAANYEIVLNNLLSKDIVDECDVLEFIKNLALLTKAIKHQNNRFKTYAPTVKSWIGAYQTIFSDAKISEKALKCINKSCSVTTEIFFNLMQSFRQFEPEYSQELCYHWKEIASRMKGPKRANSFTRHIELFKTIIENLRTAKDRCEQVAILSILKLYIDHVPSDKMTILKERHNKDIVEKLIELKRSPTILNHHYFLHNINAMGRCIISLQPTKIICEQLSFYFNILNYAMWVDFNLRDNSIFCIAVSLIDNTDRCWAAVTGPKIKESMSDEHEIEIRGTWSILRNGETFRKKISVTTFIPIKDRSPMWKSKLRSIFRFESNTDSVGGSLSQDRFVANPSQWSQRYKSDASSSIGCLPKDTTLRKIYETSTVQTQQRFNMNSLLATPFPAELKLESPKKCEKDVAGANYSMEEAIAEKQSNDKYSGDDWKLSNEKLNVVEKKQLQDIKTLNEPTIRKHNHRTDLDPFSPAQSDTEELNKDVENFIQETDSAQSSPGRSTVNLKLPYNKYAENDKTFNQLKESVSAKAVAEPVFKSLSRNATQKQTELVGRQNESSTRYKSVAKTVSPIHKNLQKQNENEMKTNLIGVNDGKMKLVSDDAKQPGSNVRMNDSGMVFDDKGCVFFNDEELQSAGDFYIKNNGLEYLKTDEFNSLQNYQRERIERELRAIHTMINEGFDVSHRNDEKYQVDQDLSMSDNSIIQTARGTAKRKSSVFNRSMNQLNEMNVSRVEQTKRRTIDVSEVSALITHGNSLNSNVSDDDTSSVLSAIPSNPTKQLYKQKKFDMNLPSDDNMKPNIVTKIPQNNKARNIISHKNLNQSSGRLLPDQVKTTMKSQIDSLEDKLPTYASKRVKPGDENKNNDELERNSLPSIANVKETDFATTNDINVAVPKAIEPNKLNACHKPHIEECKNSECNSLVTHLTDLMKKPVEICNPHRRRLMELLQGLESIEVRDHRQLNFTDLAALMNTTIVAINKAAHDAKTISNDV